MSGHYHFDKEQLDWLEDALLIGLNEHGECERIRAHADELETCKPIFGEALVPAHPTGTHDVINRFANALTIVRTARNVGEENEAHTCAHVKS